MAQHLQVGSTVTVCDSPDSPVQGTVVDILAQGALLTVLVEEFPRTGDQVYRDVVYASSSPVPGPQGLDRVFPIVSVEDKPSPTTMFVAAWVELPGTAPLEVDKQALKAWLEKAGLRAQYIPPDIVVALAPQHVSPAALEKFVDDVLKEVISLIEMSAGPLARATLEVTPTRPADLDPPQK